MPAKTLTACSSSTTDFGTNSSSAATPTPTCCGLCGCAAEIFRNLCLQKYGNPLHRPDSVHRLLGKHNRTFSAKRLAGFKVAPLKKSHFDCVLLGTFQSG